MRLSSRCIFTGGYAAWKVGICYREQNAMRWSRFSGEVRAEAERNGWRYEVIGGREEGMLLYLRRPHFLAPEDAVAAMERGLTRRARRSATGRRCPCSRTPMPILVSGKSSGRCRSIRLLVHAAKRRLDMNRSDR